jgi:hypothetical protein
MTFGHLNRRIHLYLGLALLPWLFMYGISSIPFAHTAYFDARDAAKKLPLWTMRSDAVVDVAPPDGSADDRALRPFGAALLRLAGISGASFGVYRQSPNQINVYSYSFWKSTQLKYYVAEKRLTVEDRRFRWDHFLTGMHGRGGFEQEGVLALSWSVVVDLVCAAILVWIASGIYMWWTLPGHRGWGWLALASGTISFVVFTLRL